MGKGKLFWLTLIGVFVGAFAFVVLFVFSFFPVIKEFLGSESIKEPTIITELNQPYEGGGLRITVTDIQTVNDPEASDKNIVEIYWVFENISQKENHYVSGACATAYADDVSVSSAFNSIHYDQRIRNIDLAVGKRTEGYYCVEVPKDAKRLEVHYIDEFSISNVDITFVFDIPPVQE